MHALALLWSTPKEVKYRKKKYIEKKPTCLLIYFFIFIFEKRVIGGNLLINHILCINHWRNN